MISAANPWTDRFLGLGELDTIKRRTQLRVEPLRGLEGLPTEEACDRITDAWRQTFYPTTRACEIIRETIECAASHASRYYPNTRAHLSRMYLEQSDIEPYTPILLTGPAGTGKTQLRMAIERLLPAPTSIQPHPGHGPMPLVSVRSITVRGRNSVGSLLKTLVDPDLVGASSKIKQTELFDACARWQYTCGVCCLFVDELQFLTQSSVANTLLSQVLLGLSYVRVPFVVVVNYSVGHRLRGRRSEELQRLLGRPVILLPDGPDSADWLGILGEYQRAAPDVYEFQFGPSAKDLWSWSAGLKRELVKLLVLAYRQVRRSGRTTVLLIDVERAYASTEFAVARGDIEALIMHGAGSQALREDLQCPFPIAREAQAYDDNLEAARAQRVATATLDASSTLAERKAKLFIEEKMNPSPEPKAGARPAQPRSKPVKRTAAGLKEAGEQFRKQPGT